MERVIDRVVFALVAVVLVATCAGGPLWLDASSNAVLATHLERTAASPLYHVLADVAAYVPVGEPGFRLAVLGAVLGAVLVLGVIRAARALLPKDPLAGVVGGLLLVLAPPFRDAAGFADPSILAACGVVWAFALAADREATARHAVGALASAAVAIGAAPWLGAPLLVVVGLWLARTAPRSLLVLGVGAIGGLVVVLWIGAIGRMPDPRADLGAFVTATSPAAVLVGIGLVGTAFAALTNLPAARWLLAFAALAAAHAMFVDPHPTIVLALFAIGASVIPGAIVRVVPQRRHVVAAVAGVPLVAAAALTGATLRIDDPGDAPARLANDLLDELPPGPGVFVATRGPAWSAIEYAQLVGLSRPDLALVPPLPPTSADVIVANALRAGRIAAADMFAFGRLDPQRAFPRGRSFQLLAAPPEALAPIRPPAHYRSAIGETEGILLALALARYEGGFGRLDASAHAAGVAHRFNAADRALLATAQPVHPPLFGLLPEFDTPVGPWLLELFGDDLAWVAGLDVPDVPADAPPARRLHALWRKLLTGQITADDPAIAALGPAAVAATKQLVPKQP